MKKLLIAIAAAATAIGTYAATAIGGAGFDTADTADTYSWTQTGGFSSSTWVGADAEGVMTRQTTGLSGFDADARPAGYNSKNDDGFMALKTTFGNPVTQYANEGSIQRIGDGFYYDGLVKFTACDETPDLTAEAYKDAKIGFFPLLESDEDGADAYLCIWAAGNETNLWKTTKKIDDAWHRVTIKMIANANRTGAEQAAFVVFIDGKAVDCMDAQAAFTDTNLTPAAKKWWMNGQLFASLDATGTEVTGVLYDGQGAIDEVGFADVAPEFAIDAQYFSVTYGDTIEKLYLVGPDGTITPASGEDIELKAGDWYYYYDAAGERVSIKAIDAVPFTPAKDTAFPIPAAVEALATVTVDESVEYYADAASAFEAAQDAEADAIVTLKAGVTQVDALVVDSDFATTLDLAGFAVDAPITVNTDFVITNSSDAVAEDGLLAGRTLQEIGLVAGNVSIYNSYIAVDSTSTGDDYYNDYAALIYSGQVGFEISDFETASSYINYADGLKAEAIPDTAAWQIVPAEVATKKVTLTATHATALMNDGAIESGADVEVGTTIFVTATANENYDTPVITVNGDEYNAETGYTIAETDEEVVFAVTASATEWTITYLDNGDPVDTDTYTIENRGDKALHADLEKADYTFEGWFKGDVKVTSLAEQTGDLELVAKWTAIPYVAQVGTTKYLNLAEAAKAAKAGDTITLLADVTTEDNISTEASAIDLNSNKLGAKQIYFAGTDAKTVSGGEMTYYKGTVSIVASNGLSIASMTFHTQVNTYIDKGYQGAGELVVTGCTFLNDLNQAGTSDVSTQDTSCTYYSFNLAVGQGYSKSTITNNEFYQARRCCLQLTNLTGPAYVYNNTFDGTKQCLTKDEFVAGRKFGAAQIFGQKAPIYIENNSYSGEWIAEPFTMYNEKANVITTEPVVFNGNTVDATVPYLWVMYMSPDDGGVQTTNMPNIVWGDLSKVAAEVDRTKGQYKAQIDVNPTEVKVETNLALPTGVTYCKDFAGAYYVEDAVVEFSAIKDGDVVIALPGASLESETLVFKPVDGFKNKFTVEAKPQGPKPTGDGAGGVEPVTDEPGVYVVSGDPSTHNVSIDPASLQPGDTIRVTDSTIGKITGVPADQIEIKLNGVTTEIDKKYFVGGDAENGFSLELSDAAKAELVEATEDQKPLVIGDEVAVTIKTVAGLKYQLVRGTEVGSITEALGNPVLGDGQALKLEDANKPEGKAFYVIKTSK